MNQVNIYESWGSWILSDKTSNSLKNEHVDYNEGENLKKYLDLIKNIKSKTIHETDVPREVGSLMSDYLPFNSFISIEKDVSLVCINEMNVVNDLVQQLLKNIRGKSDNVQEVVELVSNTSNEVLIDILSDVWQELTVDEEKKTFIKLISSCALSLQIFCQEILLKELKENINFYITMEIVHSEAQWLGSQLILYTLLPLLKDSSSLLVKEPAHLNRCMESFSNIQKCDLLIGYIDVVEGKLLTHHLQILEILLENIPLNNYGFTKLVDLLSVSLVDYSDDRTLGKILLSIADNITIDISKNALNDFSVVCNNFKGFMRFRIKASLKKKL